MRQKEKGIVVSCEVKPNSKNSSIEWVENTLNISVTSLAVENKANKEVIETLHKIFKRPKSQIRVIAGSKSRSKSIFIEGITEKEAADVLDKINQ